MLIYSIMDIDGLSLRVPLYARIQDNVGKDIELSFRQILGKRDSARMLQDRGYLYTYHAIGDRVFPHLEEAVGIDLSLIYSTYMQHRTNPQLFEEETYTDFANQVGIPEVTPQVMCGLLGACKECYEYIEEPTFRIDADPAFFKDITGVPKLIATINNSVGEESVVNPSINMTKFMQSPEDEVFIEIPNYEDIKLGEYLLPMKSEVMPDYPVKAYNEDNYMKFLRNNADLPMIVGNETNNKLEIQPNEKDYYDSLCALIEYGISKEYPDMTLEECKESGISSRHVKDYLGQLAITVGQFNWNHTGAYPITFVDKDEEGEITDEGRAYGSNIEDFTDFKDASLLLKKFLETISSKNIYAPAEMIIKLLRWGNRKPTTIRIENFPNEYILATQTVRKIRLGISDCELAYNDGAEFTVVAPLTVNAAFGDMQYLRDQGVHLNALQYPMGLICHRYFLSKDTNSEGQRTQLSQTVVLTWIDVLEILKQNPSAIKGIRVENGSYVIDDLNPEVAKVEMQTIQNAVNLIHTYGSAFEYIPYTSKRVIALTSCVHENYKGYSYVECLNRYMFEPRIVNELGTFAVIAKDEIEELVVEGYTVSEILCGRIAGAIMPTMVKAFAKLQDVVMAEELTLTKALNVFAVTLEEETVDLTLEDVEETQVIDKQLRGGSGIMSSDLKVNKVNFAEKPQEKESNKTIPASMGQSNEVKELPTQQTQQAPVQPQETKKTEEVVSEKKSSGSALGLPYADGFFFSDVEPHENMIPLVLNKDGIKTQVAYLIVRDVVINGKKSKQYLFANVDEERGRRIDMNTSHADIKSVLSTMLNDLYRVATGAGIPVCKFTDYATMRYLVQKVGEWSKTVC